MSKQATGPGPIREDDSILVQRARLGEGEAFEELVRRYRNEVFALAYHFVRDREEAWDASQEVFIKAYRALARFRGEAAFKTWLMRITANQCKDCLKRRRVETVALDEALGVSAVPGRVSGPSQALEAQETSRAIAAAIEMLPAKHRTAFILREFEGLSYEEMAQVIRCRIGTVMSRLHHARRKLQKSLIRMGVVEGSRDEQMSVVKRR
jgi:RNA polymerase sigma-70 factor (ECF subfamily)